MKPSCHFCEHFSQLDENVGECRRKPPTQTFVKRFFMLQEITTFPKVKRDDHCGEHKEKN